MQVIFDRILGRVPSNYVIMVVLQICFVLNILLLLEKRVSSKLLLLEFQLCSLHMPLEHYLPFNAQTVNSPFVQ